ncbi:MAG: hypothetical protein KBT06_07800 [Prevotellaceae bacterium]|nr:hypothetical protein [Candidatus Colivivens equi]MCQ2077204.1 hypothetical protein [Bacteroidaceae bacterium]
MDSKIQELTDKLLNEGVKKGQAEAEKIIADANEQSKSIIEAAQKQAEDIILSAKKEQQTLSDNTKSELKMFSAQSINALKSEIANVLTNNVINDTIGKIAADKEFLNHFILKLAEKWASQEDIIISAEDSDALKSFFAANAKYLLDKGVKIEEVHGQKALFSIKPQDGSYKVNFGEEEFENYFKSFLRPQLVDLLFN